MALDSLLTNLKTTNKASVVDAINEVESDYHTHSANTTVHITAAERTAWNAKAGTGVSTTSANGLMSSADKTKLDGITAGANKYTLPQATASALGGVMLSTAVNSTSTTLAATASAVKTAYDLAATKASSSAATTTAAGLMSAADKTKLDGVASGAQANQNAFSNVYVGTTTIVADSPTDTLTIVAGSNITLTPDATNDKLTIAATNTTYAAATTSANGLMSSADKTKLDGIATGANNYTLPTATASVLGGVKNGTNISNTSGVLSVADATTAVKGVVQLNNSVTSTSTTLAATANAVKTAYDLAAGRATTAVATTSANGLMSAADKTKVSRLFNGGRYLSTEGSILGTANTVMKSANFYVVSARPTATSFTLTDGPTALANGTRFVVNATDTSNYICTVTAYNATTKTATVTWNDTVAPTTSHSFRYAIQVTESAAISVAAIGTNGIAAGEHSTVIGGQGAVAIGVNAIAGGYSAEATNFNSIAIGYEAKALANNAVSLGYNNRATSPNSISVGRSSLASGNAAFAHGGESTASGDNAFAGGNLCVASGANSIGLGWASESSAHSSAALGYGTIATNFATLALGKYNSMSYINASNSTDTMSAIVLGNGASKESRANAFRVTYGGKVYAKTEFQSTGADYAEFFEWFDGNPEDEDRRGLVVSLDGEKIRPATQADKYILGIISVTPSIVGDAHEEDWQGRFLTDEWGAPVYGWVDSEQPNPETGEPEMVKAWAQMPNPDWNPSEVYVPREERKEWDKVGLVGKLAVRQDGTLQLNGFAKLSDVGGILTHSDEPTQFRVMKIINNEIARVFVK